MLVDYVRIYYQLTGNQGRKARYFARIQRSMMVCTHRAPHKC